MEYNKLQRAIIAAVICIGVFALGWWTGNRRECAARKQPTIKTVSRWAPKKSDTSGYWCRLYLKEDDITYCYHGQCCYDYFTYHRSDSSIDVLWSYRPDCMLDMDMLESTHGVEEYPRHGEVFATLRQLNDTILQATYACPAWVQRVNAIAGDSLFATYYYLDRE